MKIEEFAAYRERINSIILEQGTIGVKRFFSLDSAAYRSGVLPARTKELLGLVASMVLRCNDCILYHLIQCRKEGLSDEEMWEAWGIALMVGGSIVIPHLRFAVEKWTELKV